jgi:hypothetical protein
MKTPIQPFYILDPDPLFERPGSFFETETFSTGEHIQYCGIIVLWEKRRQGHAMNSVSRDLMLK